MNFSDNIGFYSNEALPLLTSGQKFCLLSQETSFVTYTCDFAAVCPRLFCDRSHLHKSYDFSAFSRCGVSLTLIRGAGERPHPIATPCTSSVPHLDSDYSGVLQHRKQTHGVDLSHPISHAYALCSLIGECGRIQTFS